jgi:hypothetical protein
MRRYPLYGNVIVDSSNSTALGGTLTISNSCNTSLLNNRASIAFAVADISYGAIKKGLFSNNVDTADARITAIVDTVSPTVGTGLSLSISPNHSNPPVEALRIRSNGNIGIGTQTPQFTLDVNGNLNVAGNAIFNNDLTLNQNKIHLGTGSGVTNQGINSICIGANAGASNMPINSIQINATGTNISSQTTASSCVIAPIRTTTIDYANNATLFYNTSTREVFKVPSASFPILTSNAGTAPAGGFASNIRNILNIPAGLWSFNWSVHDILIATPAYTFMVYFASSAPTEEQFEAITAGSNYGAVCSRSTSNVFNASVPLTHYQSFLYESNGGVNAYLCGYISITGNIITVTDFSFNAIRIR